MTLLIDVSTNGVWWRPHRFCNYFKRNDTPSGNYEIIWVASPTSNDKQTVYFIEVIRYDYI